MRTHIRIDRWIKSVFPGLTKRQIEEAVDRGLVVADCRGRGVKKGEKLSSVGELDCSGLKIHVELLKKGNPELTAEVVHEAEDFVAIDKPSGMPSLPHSLFDTNTVTQWLYSQYPECAAVFTGIQPTVVPHRLDTGTSGLLLVAKNPLALSRWRDAFKKKRMRKRYLAWCWGSAPKERFEVNYGIAHSRGDRRVMVIPALGERYRPPILEAQTIVDIWEQNPKVGVFLASLECYTGVTHQVRIHMAKSGYPLVGDSFYDAQFEGRAIKPEYHELRATDLEGEGLHFQVPVDAFRRRYRT